jgi:hypothetical protein
MTVKELIALLNTFDKNAQVLICDNGSILATAHVDETASYNEGNDSGEFFILTEDY